MTKWTPTNRFLPPFGKYVLARHTRGTWVDEHDPEGVNYVVVQLMQGNKGEANNPFNYHWKTFGRTEFFGDEISHWAEFDHVEKETHHA